MTMYFNKLAVCIKIAGKIQKDNNESVKIPFGSEYSIYLKNMDTKRILAQIDIDGTDIGDGTEFIVPANGSIDIERYIKNGNFKDGNKFKFIERTSSVENHRGIKAEDSLARISYRFEKRIETQTHDVHHYYNHYYPLHNPWYWNTSYPYYGSCVKVNSFTSTSGLAQNAVNMSYTSDSADCDRSIAASACAGMSFNADSTKSAAGTLTRSAQNVTNDVGITVPGSISSQQFQKGAWFPVEEQKHAIILKLIGQTEKGFVQEAVTVKKKCKCQSCGRNNKSIAKFCTNCGTSLLLI